MRCGMNETIGQRPEISRSRSANRLPGVTPSSGFGLLEGSLAEIDYQPSQTSQRSKYSRLPLDFNQRPQVIIDIAPIQLVLVADDHSFGVANIQRARGEQLENHQVFGRASTDLETRPERIGSCATDYAFLKRESAQGHVNPYA